MVIQPQPAEQSGPPLPPTTDANNVRPPTATDSSGGVLSQSVEDAIQRAVQEAVAASLSNFQPPASLPSPGPSYPNAPGQLALGIPVSTGVGQEPLPMPRANIPPPNPEVGLPQHSSVAVGQEPRPIRSLEGTQIATTSFQSQQRPIPLSAGLPLDARIPASLKQKIWANDYVDLAILLTPADRDHFNISMSTGSGDPALCLIPKKQAKINSIEMWNTAFNIYMSVFLQKFPEEAMPLLKHTETVHILAQKGGDFVAYDENVRYSRQLNPHPWDTFFTEQYVQAMAHRPQLSSSVPAVNSQFRIV